MDFFTEDYLMHWGVKGMKWKKRKKRYLEEPEGRFETPDEYMYEAGQAYHDRVERKGLQNRPGTWEKGKWMREYANNAHRQDQGYARQQAYKKNQRRIAKQQRKSKVNNALKKVKNKVFTDTSGMKKVGSHTYVKFEEPVITSTSGSRSKKRR